MKNGNRVTSILSLILAVQMVLPPPARAIPCNEEAYNGACGEVLDAPDCEDEDSEDSGDNNGSSTGSGGGGGCSSCQQNSDPTGMPVWWVSRPNINLRLEDQPLVYRPAYGPRVALRLSYRQRGTTPEPADYFSLGTNWSCSLRAYVTVVGDVLRLHRGGAGFVDYQNGVPHFREGSVLTLTNSGSAYELVRPNGSRDVFATIYANTDPRDFYFLTQRFDPHGNVTTFNYSTNAGVFRLNSVVSADGKTTSLSYTNLNFPNRVTSVTDPSSRVARMTYDTLGFLTNVTDTIGMSSSFGYDAGAHRRWITNLTTPYGVTGFRNGGTDQDNDGFPSSGTSPNRWLEINPPTGGKHLYLFQGDCTAFLPATYSPVPTNNPNANTFDNVNQRLANSFHWTPLQSTALSTANPMALTTDDYLLGAMDHWLQDANTRPAQVISLTRQPSPDGSTPGQLTWYDYPGKGSYLNELGSTAFPSLVGRVLPDGSTEFAQYQRDSRGHVTNRISSYTTPAGLVANRTNKYILAANEIDLLQEIGPKGEQVVSNHFGATAHRPDRSYDAQNQETRYWYNANAQVAGILNPAGLTTTNFYLVGGSNPGRLATNIDLEIRRTNTYTYADGLMNVHTDERGLDSTHFWDNLQRPIGVLFPDGSTTSNRYTFLNLTATKDRLGYWAYSGFNSLRQKVAETNANGVVTRNGYCDCGALASSTNAWSTAVQQVTQYAYDFQGHRTYVLNADGYYLTNWFNAVGQLYQSADGTSLRTLFYNNQGLLTVVSNALGAESTTVFDNEDRPIFVTDIHGVLITNTYDVLDRLSTRTAPDGGVESFGYSARGLVAFTNQLGFTNFFAYDEGRRRTFETNANAELIRYTYNPAGDLLTLTDGKNQVTTWNFDEYGLVTNKLDQAGAVIFRYKYDADRRLTNRWSAAVGETAYAYEPVGSLTNVHYPANTELRYAYDPLNRLTNMVDSVGTTIYAYTVGSQLWTEDGPFASDTVTNTFVNRLRAGLALQQPTGYWTNGFGYDGARRYSNVIMSAGTFSYKYPGGLASPRPISIALPNTSFITNTYDASARLLTTSLKDASLNVLDAYAYSYDLANQRGGVTRTDSSTVAYAYDKIGQLTVADSSVNAEDRGYFYDTAWNLNRRTNNGTPGTFCVNVKNELTNAPSPVGTNTFDASGNLLTSHNGDWLYTYDDENQLISLEDASTNHTFYTRFFYDGLLRLRKRVEYLYVPPQGPGDPPPDELTTGGEGGGVGTSFAASSTNWVVSAEIRYIYDGRRAIQERDGNNGPTVTYTRGSDLGGGLETAGGIGGLLARSHGYSSGTGNWSTHNYYHVDGNGNITYIVNASQTLAASYRYDPYGNLISKSGTLADANVYRFSSKELHVASAMYYYLYRWYEPNLQRWINRDPIEEFGGINLYAFIKNDPMGVVDPFGLEEKVDPNIPENMMCATTRISTNAANSQLGTYLLTNAPSTTLSPDIRSQGPFIPVWVSQSPVLSLLFPAEIASLFDPDRGAHIGVGSVATTPVYTPGAGQSPGSYIGPIFHPIYHKPNK